ncbi:transcription initiation factor TFIID, subunit TAF5 [Myriangium duriaei CBS 260.36]|uniref:Transcription initiation factor TFIID, subunit TAF5 n=1 Tax=Myriangium duriaei CBS 260.36 TaxID=1168546 RepID=A0A9P4MJF4_9PEZI|nr:transcription initiation factor TFIID, subunit TAF5 [Myriangium duriaei CBS 260.36]
MSGPQHPPQRTASVGPQSAGMGSQAPPPQHHHQPQSQQNLNQIVLEYLAKKGYSRTEAMLRKESFKQDAEGRPIASRAEDQGGEQYFIAFDLILRWVETVLDIYKAELKRLLWPLFVYSFTSLAADFYPKEAERFFNLHKDRFEKEFEDDLRALSGIRLPEHVQSNDTAKLYRENKYRLTLSTAAFSLLVQHLESKETEGGSVVNTLLSNFFNIITVDRAAAGQERSLARLLASRFDDRDVPAEDEGIPGHNPGSANTSKDAPPVLTKLNLAPLPMENDLMEDVKAELEDQDAAHPPPPGKNTLVEEFEKRIKQEPLDDAPSRDSIPFPPSLARDVAMEVQRIKENRDRFKIEGRTGGVGPGVSVTMFTFHNTYDSLNCIEFSGDNTLVAVGTSESYIRLWSLENKPLTSPLDPPEHHASQSRRLIGHSGPVYALSFSPSIHVPNDSPFAAAQTNGNTPTSYPTGAPRYLLSSSADSTIRLWDLTSYTQLVIYRSHSGPVWDVRFSPYGHYFLSCSSDRTARIWSTSHISPHRLLVGHDADTDVVAWHPNAAYAFTGSSGPDRTVRMWDVQRGSPVRMFTGHTGNITALAAAPSGKLLASADDRGDVCVWDLAAGRLAKRLRGHARCPVWSLDWSVESNVLVSGGADGTVRVWDVQPFTSAPATEKVAEPASGAGGATTGGAGAAGTSATTAGGKVDTAAAAAGVAKKTGTAGGKGKDVVVSPDQISAFPTKKSPVYKVRFTQMNLVLAGGAYLP